MKIVEKDCSFACLVDRVSFLQNADGNCLEITDIGGISEEFLGSIAESKHESAYEVFENARKNAYQSLKQDLLSAFGKQGSYGFELLQSKKIAIWKPRKIFEPVKTYLGQMVYFDKGELQNFNLKGIQIYSDAVGTVIVKVIDVTTGLSLYTSDAISISIGFNNIIIDKTFEVETNGEQILIQVEPNEALNDALYVSTCGQSNVGDGCLCSSIQATTANIIQYDSILEVVNESYQYTEGFFCADYSIECNIDRLICRYSKLIEYAFYLKVYIEMINIQITSPRINFLAEQSLDAIQKVIMPNMQKGYYQALNRSVKNLLTTDLQHSSCFSCMPESDMTVRFMDRN